MKVLFVTNNNYSISGTTTNIFNKLFFDGKLIEKIEEIDILAGKDRYFDAELEDFHGIKIFRTWSWSTLPKEDIKEVFKKRPVIAIVGIVSKILFHIDKSRKDKFFIDKSASRAYYRMLKKINADKYDLIVTVSARYYQTDAVMRYCNDTGQKFVFYQVDPCGTNMGMPEENADVRVAFEKELYEKAEAVITTPIIFEEHKNTMNADALGKVVCMEFPLIVKPKGISMRNEKKLRLPVCMFLGNIYGGIRNPDYTLRLFRPLIEQGKVALHFVGVRREEFSAEFSDLDIKCYGTLPLEEAANLMQEADFLINIGNSVINQVPSKIFDYISTGKPIINVCKSRQCPTLAYISKYSLGINLYEEDNIRDRQINLLEGFIISNYKKTIQYSEVVEAFKSCTPIYCAKQLYDVLNKSIQRD